MQAIFEHLSAGDLFGLAGIAVMVVILAANCSYQKHRALARDRVVQPAARPPQRDSAAVGGVVAQA